MNTSPHHIMLLSSFGTLLGKIIGTKIDPQRKGDKTNSRSVSEGVGKGAIAPPPF